MCQSQNKNNVLARGKSAKSITLVILQSLLEEVLLYRADISEARLQKSKRVAGEWGAQEKEPLIFSGSLTLTIQ